MWCYLHPSLMCWPGSWFDSDAMRLIGEWYDEQGFIPALPQGVWAWGFVA